MSEKFPFNALASRLAASKISNDQLRMYLIKRGFINPNQCVSDLDGYICSQMILDENWAKVEKRIYEQ